MRMSAKYSHIKLAQMLNMLIPVVIFLPGFTGKSDPVTYKPFFKQCNKCKTNTVAERVQNCHSLLTVFKGYFSPFLLRIIYLTLFENLINGFIF